MKFKRIISSLFLFLSITLSSCSLFGGADEGLMIERVESTMGENGSTLVTMYFTDEDVEPLTFEIPRGETGEIGPIGATGLGIKEITSRQSEDGLNTILTITFTSEDVAPQEIIVPNGVSVTGVDSSFDPDTNITTITLKLSDGTFSEPIEILNGVDGVGIQSVEYEQDTATGDWIITFYYTDELESGETFTQVRLPYKVGDDGRGISSTLLYNEGYFYYLIINYTDGNQDILGPIEIPQATKWIHGLGSPNSVVASQCQEGDYYFDIENYIIYLYDGTQFIEIINLTDENQNTTTCTVTFDPNGGTFVSETIGKIQVNKGETIDIARIPICAYEGKSFAGYYTTAEGPANPLSGKLTDLTPIYRDIVFYAYYI